MTTDLTERGLERRICTALTGLPCEPVGSGLGGLDWSKVRIRMNAVLKDLRDVRVVVFEPGGGSEDERVNRSRDVPETTAGRAALIDPRPYDSRSLLDTRDLCS